MDNILLAFGGAAKALGDGKFRVPMVVFGSPTDTDLSPFKDFFTKETDFAVKSFPAPCTVYFNHGQDPILGKKELGGGPEACKMTIDDDGVWAEGVLDMANRYEGAIYKMIEQGKLGGSSGTIFHLMGRKSMDNGSNWVNYWPIGKDMSLTPRPADPKTRFHDFKSMDDYSAGMKSLAGESFAEIEAAIKSLDPEDAMKSLSLSDSKVWNGAAAEKRMKAWATNSKGELDISKLSRGYARKGDKLSDLGFPFADVVNGELQANPRGVIAAGTATMGARSGKEPDDADAIRKVLAPYYDKMKMTPPWKKEDKKSLTWEELAAKSQFLGSHAEDGASISALSRLHDGLMYNAIPDISNDDTLSGQEKRDKFSNAVDEYGTFAKTIFNALHNDDGTPDDDMKMLREIFSDPKEFSTQPIRSALKHVTEGLADTLERWDSEVFRFLSQGAKSTEVLKPKNQDALRSGYLQVEAACKYMKEIMDRAGVDYSESGTKNIDKAEEDKKSIELAQMNLAMIEVKRDNERLLTT